MANETTFYNSPLRHGYWTDKDILHRNIWLKKEETTIRAVPVRIRKENSALVMELSTFDGMITAPVNDLPGLKVVVGDSKNHPYEEDGELLIEIRYFKIDRMEDRPRRIRPTGIMFGILGDTSPESAERGGHRAMGESADFYLEGQDTKYDPEADKLEGNRSFPFWRIGVWGDPVEMAQKYLPTPQSAES